MTYQLSSAPEPIGASQCWVARQDASNPNAGCRPPRPDRGRACGRRRRPRTQCAGPRSQRRRPVAVPRTAFATATGAPASFRTCRSWPGANVLYTQERHRSEVDTAASTRWNSGQFVIMRRPRRRGRRRAGAGPPRSAVPCWHTPARSVRHRRGAGRDLLGMARGSLLETPHSLRAAQPIAQQNAFGDVPQRAALAGSAWLTAITPGQTDPRAQRNL
jgi:hypothetical protein